MHSNSSPSAPLPPALDFLSSHGESAENIGFCSKEMASKMSHCSHQRAIELTPLLIDWPSVYGLSCTATIISHYKRRGDYRAHIACTNSFGETSTTCFTFKKGYRRRHEEEAACANLAVKALYEMLGFHDVNPSEVRRRDTRQEKYAMTSCILT